jgi:acyl-CoA oxidase
VQIIERDLVFRNHEVIAPSKSKAIQKLLLKLCANLRSVAGALVDAFAIPDGILRAPIATTTFVNAQDVELYDGYLRAAGFQLKDMM